jgi:REP element-mobilizing transposase RayT
VIIGFHLTWTTYGHWFPNDPRGSWSDEVWEPRLRELRDLDDGRKVTHPRPVPRRVLQGFLDSARSTTKWEPVWLTSEEIQATGTAFAEAADQMELPVHACAILPNHAHAVVGLHPVAYERIVNRLKGRSSQRVRETRGLSVASERAERVPVWTQGYWVRYIDDLEQMSCAIEYVNRNPVREGLGRQDWKFITRFRG